MVCFHGDFNIENMNNTYSPIIVFGYNRPMHLKRTLTALSENVYADQSVLYIFCDGAKSNATEDDLSKIHNVREVAREKCWCKEVRIIEAPINKGLANSIIDGVTEVINQYGKAIILEDDLVTSPFFLKYMNEALEYYESRKSVFSIGANRPPVDKMEIPADYPYDVFVCLRSYSTGWATWKDRWDQVDWSMDYMEHFLSQPEQVKAFNRAGEDMTKLLIMQRDGEIDSWAMRFGFAHFYQHAIAILPCHSYVDNIGFDGTGIHSGTNIRGEYRNDLSFAKEHVRFLDVLYEDRRIINAFYSRFYPKRRPIWKKAINYIARKLGKKPVFVIKKKVYC